MSRTAAGLIGGMPMLSESEFKAQKKAAAKEAKEGILREQTKAAAIIEQAKQEKKEASRKVKSSALNKLVASSAAQVRSNLSPFDTVRATGVLQTELASCCFFSTWCIRDQQRDSKCSAPT
jgi:hypothetical protein